MAIRALSPREVDRFNSARATVARYTDNPVEWFADDSGAVVGGIGFNHDDLEWSLVVLWRDPHGHFHTFHRDAGLPVLDEARRVLVDKMAVALTAGDEVLAARAAA